MASVIGNFQQIMQSLKQGDFKMIYLLHGEEVLFIDRLSDYIEQNALSEAEKGFNQMVFYGKDTDVQSLIQSARRFPMMAEKQLIIVKEAQSLRDIKKLESYLADPMPSTILVIAYKHKKADSRLKWTKLAARHGTVFEAKKLYENDVAQWIRTEVQANGFQIDPTSIQLLVEYLGTDLGKISGELGKLYLHLKQGESISQEIITRFIGIHRDFNVFELQKAFAHQNSGKVFSILHYFGSNPKAAPVPVLMGSLYNFFNKLYLYHLNKNKNPKELASAMKLYSSFFLKDYAAAARHCDQRRTLAMLKILLEFDLKLKGVGAPKTSLPDLMHEMAFKICGQAEVA